MTETEFRLTVNGAERSVACEPDTPLLDVLRLELGLAGPKFGTHLTDPRARQVLTQAADMAGWDTRVRRHGTGYGAGVARYSGVAGYCAAVAEAGTATRSSGSPRFLR